MSRPASRSPLWGPTLAVLLGLIGGLVLVGIALRNERFAGATGTGLAIRINGVDERMARDVLLPTVGWVLQIALPPDLPIATRESLVVTLRAERTGAMIEIADQLVSHDDFATLVIPESLGLYTGLLSIRATLTDEEDHELVAYRRVRIRSWLGGPPIGSRQIIHFDFTIDRDDDGRPDFERDLERFGLATPERPELARIVAERIAERALARVRRAYDAPDDPNRTGAARDPVFIRFVLEADPGPFVTRICVGGGNIENPDSVGNVRFDLRNQRKSSKECEREATAGLFPAELTIYRESDLYADVLGPFLTARGGATLGTRAADEERLSARGAGSPGDSESANDRRAEIDRAISFVGDVLGTVMAHESAHALGLVPPGRPGVGLFGGGEKDGDAYAHNVDASGERPTEAWLMNAGRSFILEDLAGLGEVGELRFRPLNYAYLKDRIVMIDDRRP
ncbi:MAG: hypothetical protein GY910_21595 [bacterium]|nr:hypothetical protein [Deltaproteobacteria bacterium]MCP4907575.1 hypothetical protein [bacterium]